MSTITFIGGGNMARSLIGGLSGHDSDQPINHNIIASDIDESLLASLKEDFGISTETDNVLAVSHADTIIIAVKPHIVKGICQQIGATLKSDALVISIAAGVRQADISRWLGRDQAVVRCMPNTPALLGAGISGLFANDFASEAHKEAATSVLGAAGRSVWVSQENDLDIVTALSGSGPAYFFHLIECMASAATAMGLPADTAEDLAVETAYGAALMARQRQDSPATLREKVTSHRGTTAAALASFQSDDLQSTVLRAMQAAENRAKEMGDELGGK